MRPPSVQLLRALRSAASRQPILHQHYASPRSSCNLPSSSRFLSTTKSSAYAPPRDSTRTSPQAPLSRDRGPPSKEDTQTDFGAMDILGNMGTPATAIDACITEGFHLNNGLKSTDGSGVMLLGGEAWAWRPWEASSSSATGGKLSDLLTNVGILEIGAKDAWGILGLLYPKPDLLILGTGGRLWSISKQTREFLQGELGIRVDIMDTGNAAAAYNLLATERGVEGVGAAMLPVGWTGRGRGR